jgi:hypothetical protein
VGITSSPISSITQSFASTFYDEEELPEDSTTRARVLAMTELIGDALQST